MGPPASTTAAEIIARLGLIPHREGGHYREMFRDPRTVDGGRSASTAIYFLLAAGEVSRWHRVDAAEVWHWYAGAPLVLSLRQTLVAASPTEAHRLGNAIAAGERPQVVVPAGVWQCARSTGAWTLVGCTVAPGFTFDGFELAPGDAAPPGGPS